MGLTPDLLKAVRAVGKHDRVRLSAELFGDGGAKGDGGGVAGPSGLAEGKVRTEIAQVKCEVKRENHEEAGYSRPAKGYRKEDKVVVDLTDF